jgi:hypothetical protein
MMKSCNLKPPRDFAPAPPHSEVGVRVLCPVFSVREDLNLIDEPAFSLLS